jgi:death-on-curing protein
VISEPKWLTARSVDAIHAALIDEHGGLHGIRDQALIDSALARPQNRYIYAEATCDIPELAAAYGFGLVKNHGYLDGNKRVGLAALLVFLRINGVRLRVTEPQAVMMIEHLAAGGVSEEELAAWIRERAQAIEG